MPPKRMVPKSQSRGRTGSPAPKAASSKGRASSPHRSGSPAPKAASSKGGSSSQAPAAPEVDEKLEGLLEEVFTFIDLDQDGQIERVELLEAEEKRLSSLEFGPKERKATVAWFKEAGCEGTPTAGMFLSKEKWLVAMRSSVEEGAAADQKKPSEWLLEKYANLFPKPAVQPVGAGAVGGEGGAEPAPTPPEYPMTIDFKDLVEKLQEARSFGKQALVLSGGREEVETFMNYRMYNVVDAKMYVSRVYGLKNMKLEEAVEDAKQKLSTAMNAHGFCKPLHIRMANAALDWSKFCCDDFPADLFDGELWSIENAYKRGWFDNGHKMLLELENEKKWKEFHVVLTSTFDLESATEFLADKIPHYDKLAILTIDPKSFT